MRSVFAGAVALLALSASALSVHAAPSATLQKWRDGGTVVVGVRESASPMVYTLDANETFTGYHLELCQKVIHAIAPKARLKYMVLTAQNTMPLIELVPPSTLPRGWYMTRLLSSASGSLSNIQLTFGLLKVL